MSLVLLDAFLPKKEQKETENPQKNKFEQSSPKNSLDLAQENLKKNNSEEIKEVAPKNLPVSYFVSATYDGDTRKVVIKLYEPSSKRIYKWYDTKNHQPYCYSNISPRDLQNIKKLVNHSGFDRFETETKYDALLNKEMKVTKIIAKDPLTIGGRPTGCIRDIIPQQYPIIFGNEKQPKVWEAAIKYIQCYINDEMLSPGMAYKIENGKLVQFMSGESEKNVGRILRSNFKDEPDDLIPYLETWIRLLEHPAPKFKRVALDIEVFSPIATRVPDAETAPYPVICASLADSEGEKRILILKRENITVKKNEIQNLNDVSTDYFETESELLLVLFKELQKYPFIITFNGDYFDLRYLFNRAQKLDIQKKDIPIEPGRRVFLLKRGIHIDLYKFFFNRSIQIYAFSNKYQNMTLDEIAKAILGKNKIELSKPISDLSYNELAIYCLNDSEITLGLTTFDDDLVMKLILVLTRISRMPMEDVSRQGVSRWIRSFMQYEHRRKRFLIPNREDIITAKGIATTKSIIKGKKYKGAIVVDPIPGVHFNVAVMDFQSLYPSIIKVHNLGYQSIRCQHEECKINKIPDTLHWVCTKQRALESALIGSLRDLRVKWYKPKAKDKKLSKIQRNWYSVTQRALKVILNASYGVFGAESFNLYCPPVAEATAALGRSVITKTIEKAQELGIQVLYGDTDSVFLKNPSSQQIKDLTNWSEINIGIDLGVEKTYRYAVLSSRKKNYLGVLEDGSVDVKGLTGKKKHIPPLLKKYFDIMQKSLSQVKTPADFEVVKKDIESIIRKCQNIIKNRKWNHLEDLAFEIVLGKPPKAYTKTTPQHVKAAIQLMESGIEIKAGDRIRFVKVTKPPHVKPLELATNSEIDTDKYIAYVRSTFDQILDALGLEFDKIIGLTKLEMFI